MKDFFGLLSDAERKVAGQITTLERQRIINAIVEKLNSNKAKHYQKIVIAECFPKKAKALNCEEDVLHPQIIFTEYIKKKYIC